MDDLSIILSDDGSHSLHSKKYNAEYHSSHGSIQESLHVFIKAGLEYLNLPSTKILEMGLGTGLNAYLSFLYASKNKVNIQYTAYELHPVDTSITSQLNYVQQTKSNEFLEIFERIHQCTDGLNIALSDHFNFLKHHKMIQSLHQESEFDLIFYDAFGPGVQEELWSKKMTDIMYRCLNNHGVLVTYCAQGAFKRNLKASGFSVEGIPGPPGKREMTRATKKA